MSSKGGSLTPIGCHESRYFSAGRPTKLVRDGDAESYDEPPSDPPGPGPAPGDAAAGSGDGSAAAAGAGAPGGADRPGGDDRSAASAGSVPAVAPAPADGAPGYRPGRTGAVAGGVGLLIAVAAVAGLGWVTMSGRLGATAAPPKPAATQAQPAPQVLLAQVARQTQARGSAALTVTGAVHFGPLALTLDGSGQLDAKGDAMSVNLHMGAPGSQLAEREVLSGNVLYLSATVDGKQEIADGGRTWVSVPLRAQLSVQEAIPEPTRQLTAGLAAAGATVTPLGTKVINGVICTGYAVAVRSAPQARIDYWVDGARLLREVDENITVAGDPTAAVPTAGAATAAGGALSMQLTLRLSDYGEPTSVTPPPAGEVIPVQDYRKDLGAGSGALPATL